MNNDELKKKICDIIAPYVSAYGEDEAIADALIAAGLTFDKTTPILAERTNGKTLIRKAQYCDEMRHRAEIAERALKICLIDNLYCCECDTRFYKKCKGTDKDKEECAMLDINDYIQQAEKELAEERKE